MQVKVSAFDVDIDSEVIDLESLTNRLVAHSGRQFEENRICYFDKNSFPGFCVGVIITVKDQKSFCTLDVGEDGTPIIRVNGLDEHTQIMDFNFFALNLENGIGVYQHYHQSAALSSLERKFKLEAKTLKEELIEDALNAARQRAGHNLSEGASVKIQRQHKAIVRVGMLVSQEGLRQLLLQYQKIKGMEYSYTVLQPQIREATPLGNRVSKKKETLTFSNPNIVDTLSREIVQAVRAYGFAKGRVFVEDAEGDTKSIKIFDMPEILWEEDYDTVVAMINDIDPGDFGANEYLRSLVQLFDQADYTHILRADV